MNPMRYIPLVDEVPTYFVAPGSLQMNLVRRLSLAAALSAVVFSSPPHSEEQQPKTAPTLDVDIIYQITRPGGPAIPERRRWLASQHLRRVDGQDKFGTIFAKRDDAE